MDLEQPEGSSSEGQFLEQEQGDIWVDCCWRTEEIQTEKRRKFRTLSGSKQQLLEDMKMEFPF